jgi:HEAT repeat protein
MKGPGLLALLFSIVINLHAQENSTNGGYPTTISAAQLLADLHSQYDKTKSEAIERLSRVSPQRLDLKQTAVDLLDDKDVKVKLAAIRACRALNASEAVPKLRKMLKGGPRFNFTRESTGGLTLDVSNLHMEVASALVQFKDTDSMDEILSRDEIMGISAFGGPLVAKYGASVLPKALDIARKNDARRHGALQAISWMRDESAVPQLAPLIEDKDKEIASAATRALGSIAKDAGLTNRRLAFDALDKAVHSQTEYVRMNAYEAEIESRESNEFPVTLDMIEKEKGVARLHIFYGLMNSKRTEMVPVLKKFIQQDEIEHPNSTTDRIVAAQTIYRLIGERVPYRGLEKDRKIYRDPYDPGH